MSYCCKNKKNTPLKNNMCTDVAKADRKHRWIRTGTVQLPSFRKFEKMLDEGEEFVGSNK